MSKQLRELLATASEQKETDEVWQWRRTAAQGFFVQSSGSLHSLKEVWIDYLQGGGVMSLVAVHSELPKAVIYLVNEAWRRIGGQADAKKAKAAIAAARIELVRAHVDSALFYTTNNFNILRGGHYTASELKKFNPPGLFSHDWADADLLARSPWLMSGWHQDSAAYTFSDWLSNTAGRDDPDTLAVSLRHSELTAAELLYGIALTWIDEALQARDVMSSTSLISEAAMAVREAGALDGWESATEFLRDDESLAAKTDGGRVRTVAELSMHALNVRHAENRKVKADAKGWWLGNRHRFKSMDAAAEAMAGKIVHRGVRTVREWIGEWTRELRSTGTL